MQPFWLEYLVKVRRAWSKAIIGPVLVVLAFIFSVCVLVDQDKLLGYRIQKVSAAVSLLAAFFMPVLAQYWVWKKDRKILLAEIAKNARPEISGDAYAFRLDPQSALESRIYTDELTIPFVCIIFLSNDRQVPTTWLLLEMNGSGTQPPCTFSDVSFCPHAGWKWSWFSGQRKKAFLR